MLFAYVLLSLSKQKLRARMKASAVHRLHENEIWNPAAAVPVLPACLAGALLLARWPWSTGTDWAMQPAVFGYKIQVLIENLAVWYGGADPREHGFLCNMPILDSSACDFIAPYPGSRKDEKWLLLHGRDVNSIPGKESGDLSVAGLHLNS